MYFQKMGDVFVEIDLSRTDAYANGAVVYDTNSQTKAPQYLLSSPNDGIRLYPTMKKGDKFIPMSRECLLYVDETKTWEHLDSPQGIVLPRLEINPLSEEEKTLLRSTHASVEIIKESINVLEQALSTSDSTQTISINDEISEKYTAYVLQKLQMLIERGATPEGLESLLKDNWEMQKNTVVSYTAMPLHPVTTILCAIALRLVDIKKAMKKEGKEETCLGLLMPGVFLESQYPDSFPDLGVTTAKEDIQALLQTHILSDNHKYLIPVSLFSQRQNSESSQNYYPLITIETDYQTLVNPYWSYEHPNTTPELSTNELQRLAMHNEAFEALFKAKQDYEEIKNDKSTLLGQLNRLEQQLKRNSVGGVGTEAVAASGAFPAIVAFNDFYRHLTNEQKASIPNDGKLYIDTLTALASSKEKNYVIGEIDHLPSYLMPGVIYITNKENKKYYTLKTYKNSLVQEVAVPPECLIEDNLDREKFLDFLVSQQHIPESKKQFISQAHLIETCIASQSRGLRRVINRYQHELQGITISNERKLEVIQNIQSKYFGAQGLLARAAFSYGRDRYGISKEILETLKIQYKHLITNEASLKMFMLISGEELSLLCGEPEIQEQIIKTIMSLENLVMFITEHLPEKVEIVLNNIKDQLCKSANPFIKEPQDFLALVIALDEQKFKAVCGAFQTHLPLFVNSATDYVAIIQYLSEAQRAIFFEKFPFTIRGGADYLTLFPYLSTAERNDYFRSFSLEQLLDMIDAAINSKDLEIMNVLCNKDSAEFISSLFSTAVRKGSSEWVSYLLTNHANTHNQSQIIDALDTAIQYYHHNIVKILVDMDKSMAPIALGMAIRSRRWQSVVALLQLDETLRPDDDQLCSVLFELARMNQIELLERFAPNGKVNSEQLKRLFDYAADGSIYACMYFLNQNKEHVTQSMIDQIALANTHVIRRADCLFETDGLPKPDIERVLNECVSSYPLQRDNILFLLDQCKTKLEPTTIQALFVRILDDIEHASQPNPDPDPASPEYIPDEDERALAKELLDILCELPIIQESIMQIKEKSLLHGLEAKVTNPVALNIITQTFKEQCANIVSEYKERMHNSVDANVHKQDESSGYIKR